ncbi:hypothetical protein MACH09_43060 [Vibrio sp. MACH09]|nr:hypothetical protein MACH09_43060 [Vibrio sp. MACH09]
MANKINGTVGSKGRKTPKNPKPVANQPSENRNHFFTHSTLIYFIASSHYYE